MSYRYKVHCMPHPYDERITLIDGRKMLDMIPNEYYCEQWNYSLTNDMKSGEEHIYTFSTVRKDRSHKRFTIRGKIVDIDYSYHDLSFTIESTTIFGKPKYITANWRELCYSDDIDWDMERFCKLWEIGVGVVILLGALLIMLMRYNIINTEPDNIFMVETILFIIGVFHILLKIIPKDD